MEHRKNTKPLIIAHRGDSVQAPENTIEACKLALQQGADGLEVDVRLCGSGDMVLFHDKLLYRHFGKYKPVYLSTLKELRSLRFPANKYKVQAGISSLTDFFEEFKGRAFINIEAKTFYADTGHLARELVRAIKRFKMQDQILISSFNPIFLKLIKLNTPGLRTGYLFAKTPRFHQFLDIYLKSDAWHPHVSLVDEAFAEAARKIGKAVYVWTVNDSRMLDKMTGYGFEGVITDNLYKKASAK